MPLPSINEATIRTHASEKSFQRGESYCREGAVISLIQRGNTLTGQVEGSEYDPYRVSLEFDQAGLTSSFCTCPYNFGGWCKHIVATLLEILRAPEDIEQRPSLSELLQPLDRDQLQELLETLSAEQPDLVEQIERIKAELQQIEQIEVRLQQDGIIQSEAPHALSSQPVTRRTMVDPQPFARQVKQVLYYDSNNWDDSPALDTVRTVIQKADAFTEKGDGENALAILEAIIDAYRESWMNLDGSSGESGELFYELDEAFAEALLSATITTDDQETWQEAIEIWEEDAEAYGIDQAFAKSQVALVQGWDDPELLAILQGETTDGTALEEPESRLSYYTLAQVRLNILKRQERIEEYLNLAKAKGCTQEYLSMLVNQDRLELAMTEAQQSLNDPNTALVVAQGLRAKGALEQALEIAELGLTFPGYGKARLAEWTGELAEGLGQTDTSFQARTTAFAEIPTLADYLKIKELAGPAEWSKLQKRLLASLRKENAFSTQAAVDIFLHEGLLKDAIEVVDQRSSYNPIPIRQVMEVAIAQQPDWVITNASHRAESIMDGGKAKYYHHAVDWLKFVHRAYQQSEQLKKWQTYYDSLLSKHFRKRKLISLMQVFK